MSCGSDPGTTPLCPSPHRIGSHSAYDESPLPRNGCWSDMLFFGFPLLDRTDPPRRSSSPVEQKNSVWVVDTCFGVHIFALTTVFCRIKSAGVSIRRSNLNLCVSIHDEPRNRLVFINRAFPGPTYLSIGLSLASSLPSRRAHGPSIGMCLRNFS